MTRGNDIAKPSLRIVENADGTFGFINICAAARWAGVSQQTFADILRRHLRDRKENRVAKLTPKEKVMSAYPELFK